MKSSLQDWDQGYSRGKDRCWYSYLWRDRIFGGQEDERRTGDVRDLPNFWKWHAKFQTRCSESTVSPADFQSEAMLKEDSSIRQAQNRVGGSKLMNQRAEGRGPTNTSTRSRAMRVRISAKLSVLTSFVRIFFSIPRTFPALGIKSVWALGT